jgi:predicted nucleic acid-binding protein
VIVLDTTILVYAVGDEHPLRDPCRAIIDAIGDTELAATTTVEVLQEFVHVRARRRGRVEAVARARAYGGMLAPLLQPSADDLDAAWMLYTDNKRLGAFDAVLAASARNAAHVTGLMSADGAFAAVADLGYVDPVSWFKQRPGA